jgi:hypothetical protein
LPLGPGLWLLGPGLLLRLGPGLLLLLGTCFLAGWAGLLLPLGSGLLLLVRAPSLLLAWVTLGIGRSHGLQQQWQDAHVDESECLHGTDLLWPVLMRQRPG